MPWRCLIVFIEGHPTSRPSPSNQMLHLKHTQPPRIDDIFREMGRGRKKHNTRRIPNQHLSLSDFIPGITNARAALEMSQIANNRFIAHKKAQNAHGGAFDCRPSLKTQSCLCGALSSRPGPPRLLLVLDGIEMVKTAIF